MTNSEVDFEAASSMMIRSRLAQICIANMRLEPMIEARALRILVEQDMPRIISEFFRLRPDLQTQLKAALHAAETQS